MKGFAFWIKDGRCHFPGVSFGYGDSDPRLVYQMGGYFVARQPSTRDWQCLGTTGTYPSTWYLWKVKPAPVKGGDKGRYEVVEELQALCPGKSWGEAKRRLIEAAQRLAAGEKIHFSSITEPWWRKP